MIAINAQNKNRKTFITIWRAQSTEQETPKKDGEKKKRNHEEARREQN